jgi:multidrug efflux pump subunit AcrA (membrane-fusion protein)
MSGLPKLRSDLVLVEQTYRGEQSFIVKDPETHKYFRFRPVEVMVMQTLDGSRTAVEAAAALGDAGVRVSASAVEGFSGKLRNMGLLERTLRERSVLLLERLRAERRRRLGTGPFKGDLMRLRWSVGDPDQFMNRWLPRLRFCFTPAFIKISLFLFALYFMVISVRWAEFSRALADMYMLRMSVTSYIILWVVSMTIIVVHELGHGFTCKYFGGQVHEIGAMLLYFEPAFFCNVNDAWTFPDLRSRLWVTAAGSWIQFVLASIAAIVWWAADPGTLASEAALAAVLFGGVTTILVNANPLLPLDGYYALSDYLEVPNLRQRAFAYVIWLVKARLLRIDLPEPLADDREKRIFVWYGVLAAVYIIITLLFSAAIAFGWLNRVLGTIGILIFIVAAWRVVAKPLRDGGRLLLSAWRDRPAVLRGRTLRDRLLLGLGGMALLGLVVPWPITVSGRFAIAPAMSSTLTAPDSGLIQQVYVREGTAVTAGTPLIQMRNFELERAATVTNRRVDSLMAREAQARARNDMGEVARIGAERATEQARLAGLQLETGILMLRASTSGTVLTPRPESLGGHWVGLGQQLLQLGLRDSLEARIALSGAGASLVRTGQPVRLVFYSDAADATRSQVRAVAAASAGGGGAVEVRAGISAQGKRPGMTGEASVTLRRSNVWGALWWGIRRRIRTDILL